MRPIWLNDRTFRILSGILTVCFLAAFLLYRPFFPAFYAVETLICIALLLSGKDAETNLLLPAVLVAALIIYAVKHGGGSWLYPVSAVAAFAFLLYKKSVDWTAERTLITALNKEEESYNIRFSKMKKDFNDLHYSDKKKENYRFLVDSLLRFNESKTIKETLEMLVGSTENILKEGYGYVLVNEEKKWKVAVNPCAKLKDVKNFNFTSGILKDVLKTRKTIFINNIENDYRYTFVDGIKDMRSTIVFPIISNNEIFGLFKWDLERTAEFDYHTVKVIQTIVHFASINISLMNTFEQLGKIIVMDELTQLYNKKEFETRLQHFISTQRDFGLSIMLIDLDHFKNVNDTYGHVEGDKVLVQLASLLKKLIRISDNVFRYGGEEFVIILPDTNEQGAFIVGERIRSEVLETPFYVKNKSLNMSVTIGIAELNKENYTMNMLITAADQALYEGKDSGRNKCVLHSKIKKR